MAPEVADVIERILLPTDGSPNAVAAARHGLMIAEKFDAEIHVLSVVNTRAYSEQLADIDELVRDQRSALEERVQEAIAAIESIIENRSTLTCESAIEYGNPREEILAYAAANDVDLITIGAQGRGLLDRLLLGSVTERVVRASEVPVLTVPNAAVDRDVRDYESILIPTDGSEAAAAPVARTVSLAEQFRADVHVLSVIQSGRGLPGPSDPQRVAAGEAVGEIESSIGEHGIAVETHVESGRPYDRINRFANSNAVDLIAMGTHGKSGVLSNVLGSVTERVLRTSEVPVLTVRSTST